MSDILTENRSNQLSAHSTLGLPSGQSLPLPTNDNRLTGLGVLKGDEDSDDTGRNLPALILKWLAIVAGEPTMPGYFPGVPLFKPKFLLDDCIAAVKSLICPQ